MRKKMLRTVVALVASIMMAISGMINPLGNLKDSYVVHADATVSSWEELKREISNGGTQTITLSSDFPYDGKSIEIPAGSNITIAGSATIYSSNQEEYDPMFKVTGGSLTVESGITLSAKTSLDSAGCPTDSTYTADKFSGDLSADGKTYSPKGFFIHVESGGSAVLNGTISDFVTSRDKATTPRYVAPVVANGNNATFNLGSTGVIKNNVVGYIVKDDMANNDAQAIKMYIKGAGPNVPRVPNAKTQKDNSSGFEGRPRSNDAGIDEGAPGTGITATAGAVIYKDGAKGAVEGKIDNNRADTGGIMVSGDGTQVNIKNGANITNNVGVQFGGGSTAEHGGSILMQGGIMSKNVAWFGGGAVFATENGVDWLQGRMSGDDLLHPQFDERKDGVFFMEGGELSDNTAFTRGGAVLADSDGVNIQAGKLAYNMSRMLGGAMYVMGDHHRYEYTVFMTKLYVHDNAAVSGEAVARNATTAQPDSDILANHWGSDDWDTLNKPMQTLLQAPNTCGDLTDNILSGEVTGGKGGGNTDDWMDGTGAQGTGGGVWLCAYGNTVFEANEPDKVVITKNYATGAPKIGSGGYHKNMIGSDRADAENNSKTSSESRSGITGGSDFHADTGNKGTVVINGLTEPNVNWVNENTGSKYESTVSSGRLNLVNKNEDAVPQEVAVEVVGNLARHGGGLAADGTFYFGTLASQATPGATIEVEKLWANTAEQKPVTIRATVSTSKGDIVLADVPLDGKANPPATEFDTVHELEPSGNTWKGEFNFPMSTSTSSGETVKLYTLVYAGTEEILIPNTSDHLTQDTELDPLSYKGRVALAAILESGKQNDIKVLFGEPEYATTGDLRKVAKNSDGSYKVTPITIRYDEFEEDENGVLVPCDDYVFVPGEMDLANLNYQINATPKYKTTIDENGNIVETQEVLYTIHLFSIPLTAPMSNDNWPLTEKYVNKDVHADIVNFDQEFEYDILAYVPLSATELTITDTLVEGLEFADANGNPSTVGLDVVQSIVMKMANNHLPGEEGTVVSGDVLKTKYGNPIDMVAWEKGTYAGQGYCPKITIEGSTLKVDFKKDELHPRVFNEFLPGHWVQVTFNARIKDEYRNLDALKELQANVEGKETSWEETDTNKQGTNPRNITFANGDLIIVDALINKVGPDPIIWAVEGPSRLFARSERGIYYATPMNDKTGNSWEELTPGSADWNNADNRYNGRPPEANNTRRQIDLEESLLDALDGMPLVIGSTIEKAAEGPSKLFAKVVDALGNVSYYQTPMEDKSGGVWLECTSQSDINNAISKIRGDADTIRYLDLESTDVILNGDSKNWPVISEEEHEGMANQAAYNVKFGNNKEGTYKTNTVTVKPETTSLKVEKEWNNGGKNEWPSNVTKVTLGVFAKTNDVVTTVYVDGSGKVVGNFASANDAPDGATPLTIELTKDEPTAKVSDLPRLKNTIYFAKEIKVNDKDVEYDGDSDTTVINISSDADKEDNIIVSGKLAYDGDSKKLEKLAKDKNVTPLCGAVADNRVWAMTTDGKYFFTEEGDESGNKDDSQWSELSVPADDADPDSEEYKNYQRAKALLGTVDANGNISKPTASGSDITFFYITNAFKALNTKPSIEKYVNNDVHADIVEFDKAFKYDLMVYVPAGSTELVISDQLVEALEFAKKFDSLESANNTKAEATTNPDETIVSVVYKETNDHKANSTVASDDGVAIDGYTAKIEDNRLSVQFVGEDDPDNAGKKLPLDFAGNWVQVTFYAKYTQVVIDAVDAGDFTKIKNNGAVISEEYPNVEDETDEDAFSHEGTLNKATANIKVFNDYDFKVDSNEVTVKPETTKVYAQKKWLDTEGNEKTEWPNGLTVTVNIYKNVEGKDPETVGTITINSLDKVASEELPKLIGVTYTVDEVEVPQDYTKESVAGDGTEDSPYVVTNKEIKYVDVEATKTWKNVTLDEIPSVKDFESFLILKNSEGEDVTDKYKEHLTISVTDGGMVYKAKWTKLDNDEYTVEEKDVPGFEKVIDGTNITNTKKPEEEKPEIEKYVNKAVHKEITLDEVFTYDVIAYVTKDADSVIITDTLDEVLKFADSASDITVVDLGESNNHKVENSIEAIKVNDDATVSEAGKKIDEAKVEIDGRTLKVTITNKLKEVYDDSGSEVVGYEYDGDNQPVTALRGHWVKVTFRAIIDGKTLDEVIARYKEIKSTDVEDDRALENVGNAPVISVEDHKGIPNNASYTIGVANEAGIQDNTYGDKSNTVTVKPNRKFTVTKTWNDNDSFRRPREVTVHLYKNGVDTGLVAVLNDSNNWQYTFTDLGEGEYTAKEDPVTKYFAKIYRPNDDITNIENVSRPWIPETPGDDYKYGDFYIVKELTEALAKVESNKEYTFKVSMKNKDGILIFEETTKLKAGGKAEYLYIPEGTTVRVEELDTNYKVTYTVDGTKTRECVIESNVAKTMKVTNDVVPSVPDTRDNSKTTLWSILLGISLIVLLGAGRLRLLSRN